MRAVRARVAAGPPGRSRRSTGPRDPTVPGAAWPTPRAGTRIRPGGQSERQEGPGMCGLGLGRNPTAGAPRREGGLRAQGETVTDAPPGARTPRPTLLHRVVERCGDSVRPLRDPAELPSRTPRSSKPEPPQHRLSQMRALPRCGGRTAPHLSLRSSRHPTPARPCGRGRQNGRRPAGPWILPRQRRCLRAPARTGREDLAARWTVPVVGPASLRHEREAS